MDYPGLLPNFSEDQYEQIIALKTAPLFECACELGVRAAKKDWFLGPAKQYGKSAGTAFQVYDDVCDLFQHQGQSWESINDPQPASLQALKARMGGGDLVRWEDVDATAQIGQAYLEQAQVAGAAFPDSPVREHLLALPVASCRALLAEVIPQDILAANKIAGV